VSAYPTEAISGNKKSGAKEGKGAIGIGVAALRYADRANPAKYGAVRVRTHKHSSFPVSMGSPRANKSLRPDLLPVAAKWEWNPRQRVVLWSPGRAILGPLQQQGPAAAGRM